MTSIRVPCEPCSRTTAAVPAPGTYQPDRRTASRAVKLTSRAFGSPRARAPITVGRGALVASPALIAGVISHCAITNTATTVTTELDREPPPLESPPEGHHNNGNAGSSDEDSEDVSRRRAREDRVGKRPDERHHHRG